MIRPTELSDGESKSLIGVVNVVLRRRRVVLTVIAIVTALVVVAGLIESPEYTSVVAFVPQTPDRPRVGMTAFAAQLGVALPAAEQDQSPDFYAELLSSRELLRRVATASYTVTTGRPDGDLAALLDVDEAEPAVRIDETIERLGEATAAVTVPATGLVRFRVRTHDPALSEQVARRAMDLVNEFNVERRRSVATEERRFVAGRLTAAAEELRGAENRLQRFLQQNRRFAGSPALSFEHDRLRREIDMRQEVYTSLVRALEQAKISEVRSTPAITIIEPPFLPVRPDSRHMPLRLLLGIVVGGLLAVATALLIEMPGQLREVVPAEYSEFERLSQETVDSWKAAARRARDVATVGGEKWVRR